jgi:hypothetical protein
VFSAAFFLAGVFSFSMDLLGQTLLRPAASEAETATGGESEGTATPVVLPDSLVEAVLRHPRRARPVPPEQIDAETLWLARVIYSETKRPEEQELVAWVVRNRVETRYRGRNTYRGVALDPYQFSAFNPNSRKYRYYSNLDLASQAPGWRQALWLAYYVRHASAHFRPFSPTTRHFFSERAMIGRDHPGWTRGRRPVAPRRPLQLDAQRFRFYEDVM